MQIITALTAGRDAPIVPESLPATLRTILKTCFAFEPSSRPHVDELIRQLQVQSKLTVKINCTQMYSHRLPANVTTFSFTYAT